MLLNRMIDTPWTMLKPQQQLQPMNREEIGDDSGIHSSASSDSLSPTLTAEVKQELQTPFYGLYHPLNMGLQYNQYPPIQQAATIIPKVEPQEVEDRRLLPPSTSPNQEQDHLRNLELSVEKTALSTTVERNPESMSDEMEEDEEQSWKTPKLNSHGKPKYHKCKQCDFITDIKEKLWQHLVHHIPAEKRLSCTKCPFITELKHHLEYHLRRHAGSKPFKCKKCDYQCVNKSMLNSHMKSHSNVYRYSCHDCVYATKYCHSLKMHLRRYNHTPNVVLDENGEPSPETVIDIYGSRRGPKVKTQKSNDLMIKHESIPPLPQTLPPFPTFPNFIQFQQAQIIQQLIQHRQAMALAKPKELQEVPNDNNALDLSSKPSCSYDPPTPKSRRKGPAFRVDPLAPTQSDDDDEDDDDDNDDDDDDDDLETTTMFSNVEAVVQSDEAKTEPATTPPPDSNNNKNNLDDSNSCQYCDISFGDAVLHTMHMGYHGFNNPFVCNMCGVECKDKVSFFVHIARVSH